MIRAPAPILTFALSATMLAEIGSGNLAPSRFFHPAICLPLFTIGYGIPLLLLRELSVGRGFAALLPLGLAYGLVNEGFLAKTLFLGTGVPVPSFNRYGMIGGVNTSWLTLITWWHLLNSLLGPLALTYTLFPAARERRWLSNRVAIGLAILEALACIAIFFSADHEHGAGSSAHFVVTVLLFTALLAMAVLLPRRPRLTDDLTSPGSCLLAGMALFLGMTLLPCALAEWKVPLPIYFGVFAILAAIAAFRALRREAIPVSAILALAMGNLAAQSLWLLIGSASRSDWERVSVAISLLGMIGFAARRLLRKTPPKALSGQVDTGWP